MIRRNGGAESGRDEPRRGGLARIACHYGWIPGTEAFTAFPVNTGSS
jgi:hypothetical protein